VQRYFRAVLKDGQPIITAVRIDIAGRFNLSPTGEQWKPFTSRQRVVTRRPGFLWDAKIAMWPGVHVRVVDSYIVGKGLLHAAVQGLFTMAHIQGEGECGAPRRLIPNLDGAGLLSRAQASCRTFQRDDGTRHAATLSRGGRSYFSGLTQGGGRMWIYTCWLVSSRVFRGRTL
jgi:hypothetical protein